MYKRPNFRNGMEGLLEIVDHTVDDETLSFVRAVRDFSQNEIAPRSREMEQAKEIAPDVISKLGELGLLGVIIPDQYGGSGLGQVQLVCIIEEISAADASVGVLASVQNSLVTWVLLTFGTDEQKKKYLPQLASGEKIGCYSLSDPGSGSDAAGMICKCEQRGDVWVITGAKNWITNGAQAFNGGLGILFATMDPTLKDRDPANRHKAICAFIVDFAEIQGVECGKNEDKLGIRASSTVEMAYDGAEIPASNLLWEEGRGFHIAMATLDGGRIGIGGQSLGIARHAIAESISYADQRMAFGKPIANIGQIQEKIALMTSRYYCDRLAVVEAAKRRDQGLDCGLAASMAKLRASEDAIAAANMAVQIHGGAGYTTDCIVEQLYRDAKITTIYEGTSEIQGTVIARRMSAA